MVQRCRRRNVEEEGSLCNRSREVYAEENQGKSYKRDRRATVNFVIIITVIVA